jgi:hypothetical protein
MRSGTTSLYRLLGSHPQIVLPSSKEPRYLTLPEYRHRTGSWYARHFDGVRDRPDALTLDASPTVFNAPLLAPRWVRKWVPDAKLVVILRDPVQRTYSHWRTGVAWLRDSPCFTLESAEASNLTAFAAAASEKATSSSGSAAARAAAGKAAAAAHAALAHRVPTPIAEIRNMREVFSFEAVARLGVMEVVLRGCGASTGWGEHAGVRELSNRSKACVLRSHVGEAVAGLWHARQALAAKRSAAENAAYVEGMRRVSVCSAFMLRSGAGVWRSSRYAANLEVWQRVLGKQALKVIATPLTPPSDPPDPP